MDIELERCKRELGDMGPTTVRVRLEVVYQAGKKYQAADALFHLPTTGMDESPIANELPVLMITMTQEEGEKTETDASWHSLPVNDGMGIVKYALPEIL